MMSFRSMDLPVQLHLVDGTFELFRCFFGAPSRKNAAGREVGAVRGLVSTLLSLLRDDRTTHVGIAFDTVIESFRNELFQGYKTGAGIDESLLQQFPLAEEATRGLGIVTWSMIEFEADDALATAAWRFQTDPLVERVLICSPDKDLCQCVTGAHVVLIDRVRKKTLDEEGVKEKYGVPPRAIPDLLALVGDVADGIPGIAGFGARTAAVLLSRYGSVEAIPATSWDVAVRGADRLQETLAASRRELQLYKRLATLRDDVPLTESLGDLEWRGPRDEQLAAVAREIDDNDLVERVAQLMKEKRERARS